MAKQAKSSTNNHLNLESQARFRQVFENSFTGMEEFLDDVLKPVFGEKSFERGYTDLIKTYPEVKSRAEASHIKSILHTGTIDIAGQDLKVFEITLDDHAKIRRSRVNIQRVVRSFPDSYERALMVFHYEQPQGRSWRLSYVEKRSSGKDTTSAKRFTYLFGPGYSVRTAAERFARLEANKDIRTNDITEAFSVQAVTKEFYTKLYNWYEWAQSPEFNVTFPAKPENNDDDRSKLNENLIRLITRLIFVWFIKQKQLVADELFDASKVAQYLKNFKYNAGENGSGCNPQQEDTTNYYHAILQNLFFATLNKKMDERKFAYDGNDAEKRKIEYGIKTLYRYGDLFTELGRKEVLKCFNKTPFLNGGLFECLDKSELMSKNENRIIYYDGFSRNSEKNGGNFACRAFIPNILFFNEEENQPGLITLLKQYNFTVEENTADDTAVALDPELLGKVFENMLASYNPETRETARNATGSFYTPREIVRYMVETSLCEHIKTKIAGDKIKIAPEVIDKLFHKDKCPEELKGNKEVIKEILLSTKVLDPACGSGAFSMGVMQCMMEILHKLDLSVDDKAYETKKIIIENCLYGVDIQTIAVQISKLRCFISLIVEETPDESKPNLGLPPLPNLETRFVAANSLIPLKIKTEKNPTLFDLAAQDVNREKNNLKRIRHEHFNAPSYEDKKRLREEDKASRERLAQLFKNYQSIASEDIERILKWDPYDQNQSSEFFDPEWMFDVSEGFDIVIGNPPYIKEYENRDAFNGFRENSPYYIGKMDIWYAFACYGIDLLSTKGYLCFIAQNNWTTSAGALLLRRKILSDANIYMLLDFNNYKIFEHADIQTMIMLFRHNVNSSNNNYSFSYRRLSDSASLDEMQQSLSFDSKMNTLAFNQELVTEKTFTFSQNNSVIKHICTKSINLSADEVAQGIVIPQDFLDTKSALKLGANHKKGECVFGLTHDKLKDLQLNSLEQSIVKPYYNSNQILQYYTNPNNDFWLIYTDSSYKDPNSMNNMPRLKKHLDKYQDIITSSNKPYGLHRARNEFFFKGEKILSLRKCSSGPIFSYSNFDCYVSQTYFVIKTKRWNYKFLLGVLNSKVIYFWLKQCGKLQGSNLQIDKEPLLRMPLKEYADNNKNIITICNTVEKILVKKSTNPEADTRALEHEIDLLVYKLYDLTPEEIAIIESEVPDSIPQEVNVERLTNKQKRGRRKKQ